VPPIRRPIKDASRGQIGCNAEAYVDDVVIKTESNDQFIADRKETLKNLWKFKWIA